jgi:predicted secreted protein
MIIIMPRREKRVAFVAHCLLNQNAMVAEMPRYAGVVSPVVDLLKKRGFDIEQLPYPEITYFGLKRWWSTKEIYDTPSYRRHCQNLARFTADSIERYHKDGYDIVLIGLDGSPSTGVRFTGASEPAWGGRPQVTREQFRYIPGEGHMDRGT